MSGSIKLGGLQNQDLFEIIVYDESYVQSKVLEPLTLKMMHEKWAMFTVYQMEQYLNSVTNTESSVSFDSRELFSLLDELKHSKSEGVQGHVVRCLELILNSSRNTVLIKYVADELQSLFKVTTHEAIALDVLKQIQKLFKMSKSCINVEELMENVYSKIKTFGCNNEEFLKYCEYNVEEFPVHTVEKSEEKLEVNHKKCDEKSASKRGYKNQSLEEEEKQENMSPPHTSRMGLSRVMELLRSEDSSCRSFALEKLIKCAATQHHGSPSRTNSRAEKDDILAELRGPDDTEDLVRALFACLKKSIKPPGEILTKAASKIRQPLAFLIADKALHASDSNFTAIFLCIKCIHWIVKAWAHDSCIHILSEKWRILLTLAHATDRQDEDLDISEKCGELLILLTNMHGWKKYNIKLDKDSVTFFLGSEHPLMRTILALSYIRGNFNFETIKNNSSGNGVSEITSIICSNDFANLRSIWRWSIGNYSQNVCIQALEVLSSALVLSEVKAHLMKYDPLEKVRYNPMKSYLVFFSLYKYLILWFSI